MKNLVELFCDVDDFCKVFIPQWHKQLLEDGTKKRQRDCRMSMSEIMTVIIGFHTSNHRDSDKVVCTTNDPTNRYGNNVKQ